jgi:hypothetical protein
MRGMRLYSQPSMGQRLRVFLCCAIAAALASVALAPAAGASWLPPVDISEPGEAAGEPHVVLDSEGNATAVWDRWNGLDTVVESAYRPAGEGWGSPEDLSEPELEGELIPGAHDAQSPRIAVDGQGDVTVVWERYAGAKMLLQAVERPSGGSWTAPVDLGEMNLASDPEPWVAVDSAGDAVAVWKQEEVIRSVFRPAGGDWEAPVPISTGESFVPQAAMNAEGDATVVWMHYDGSRYVVESAYLPAGGHWESPTLVSAPGEEAGDPQVALDADGNTLVAWRGESGGEEYVRTAYRPVGGSWEAPTNASVAGEHVQSIQDAVDSDGNAIVAWAGEAGGYDIARAAYRPSGGQWEAPSDLSADGGNAFPSDVVFDTSGNAAIVWERSDGSDNVVQAAYRRAGEDWEPAVSLSEAGKLGMDGVVVLDAPGDKTLADGDATVVWVSEERHACEGVRGDCSIDTVQAAGYDPGGITADLEVPTTAEVGESISVQTGRLFSPQIDFGDGQSVADTTASHSYDRPGEYRVSASGTEVLGYAASSQRTITIVPAGPTEESEAPQPAAPPAAGSGGSGPVASSSWSSPSAVVTPSQGAGESAACVAARASLRSARSRLKRTVGKRAIATRRLLTAVKQAHRRVAAACE